MNQERTRAVIESVLNRTANGGPVQKAMADAFKHRIDEMANELARGTANLKYTSIFHAAKTAIDQLKFDINLEFSLARQKFDAERWEQCLALAKEQVKEGNWPAGADFDRTIPTYSPDEDEQAAYVVFCNAVFQLGDLLLKQPRGTYLETASGCIWISEVAGVLRLHQAFSQPTAEDSEVVDPIWCEGVGATDLRQFAQDAIDNMQDSVFLPEPEKGLLDALALFNYNPIAEG